VNRATFVIVGGGLAGSVAAGTLRAGGFEGRIVLVGDEVHLPYSRPPLSKAVLRGESDSDVCNLRSAQWYADHDIDLELGVRADVVDPHDRVVVLESGRRIGYDKVLLATGGRARALDVPGFRLDGVHTLRTLDDSLAVRSQLRPGARVIVVGAGFIGAEVAASARMLGCEVTMFEIADVPLSRVLGAEVGRRYAAIHREEGVELHTGIALARIEGNGRVERVVATDGAVYDADIVIAGVGIAPDVGTATSSGIDVGNGIIVDERCETSVPDVFAAGDVALHPNPILGQIIRVEQWQNAQHQGAAAARNMLGHHEPFAEVPWFWSDQYDVNLQMAGLPAASDDVVFRGDNTGRAFSVFYLRAGVLAAVVGLNRTKDVSHGRRLIHEHATVRREVLGDDSVDLAGLGKPRPPRESGARAVSP
jgi:3-phenylpropionate/trans-cinnamate dioxygenase ferredoxin reductase subunit